MIAVLLPRIELPHHSGVVCLRSFRVSNLRPAGGPAGRRHTPPLYRSPMERGPGGEAARPLGRCLSPTPRLYVPTDGDWQLQVLPGAPGTARQGPTRTIMLVNSGGNATQPRAPGHERPLAAQRAAGHGRLSADSGAPGADVPLATTAGAPGHHRLSAASIATAPVPAGLRRLRQGCLPRVPANPRTLIYPQSHSTASSLRRKPQSTDRPAAGRRADAPSLPGKGPGDRSKPHHTWHYPCGFGLSGVRSKSLPNEKPTLMSRPSQDSSAGAITTTHQVHPAVQVPPRPRSCSTACTGLLLRPPSRAPPHLVIAAKAAIQDHT